MDKVLVSFVFSFDLVFFFFVVDDDDDVVTPILYYMGREIGI
jgi:hypothetical protein